MNSSIRLGRIAGIEIGITWTWLIVFALIVWSLATGVFPDQNPGLSDDIAAVAFLFSSLLHEPAMRPGRGGAGDSDGIMLGCSAA